MSTAQVETLSHTVLPAWHGLKMQTFLKGRRVGYWLSEKKLKKLNFQAFADMCRYVAASIFSCLSLLIMLIMLCLVLSVLTAFTFVAVFKWTHQHD